MSNIKVAVRVRPISEREFTLTGAEVVVRTDASEVALTNLKVSSSKAGDSRERTRRYGFDYCFDSSNPEAAEYATQEKIYETLGRSVLDAIFSGYNSCLVAYGQSASGKTYTMMGPKGDPGLTPRLCEGLFLRLLEEEKNERTYQTSVSYLEIYNERVRDLLKPTSGNGGLRVREHPRLGPYVQGLTHHVVRTLGSLMSYVEEGTKARKTASTLQNPSSSRSHALLTILLSPGSQSGHANPIEARSHPHGSRLHLVDLAGSESAATCSGIHRLKEGANINKSLVALGNVISALAERGSTGSRPGRRFIPYRDSALTWLLKDALGGNAATIMLATISPASGSYNETAHTLRFAQRAQSVVNRPVINEDPVARIIRELRAEVVRLKSLLEEKVVEADCKSIGCCKQSSEEKKNQDQQTSPNYRTDAVSSKAEGVEEEEERRRKELDDFDFQVDGSFTLHKPITGFRQYSSNESLIERCNGSRGRAKRFGSLELLSPSNSFEGRDCNRAEISELFGNEETNGPVFVDIPTLVAVLIKPEETSLQGHSAHIEEISSEAIPESPVDAEFPARFEVVRVLPEDVPVTAADAETGRDSENGERTLTSSPSPSPSVSKLERDCRDEPEVSTSSDNRSKAKLRKQASVDTAHPFISTSLQTSKRFGSVEGLTKKAESPGAVRRSHTNLERRSLTSDKSKKLNNIKEVEDRKSTRSSSVWRALTGCSGKDFQRKGSNDSDKSLRDSAESQKSRGFARKPNIDNLKRKTSKDSSSSSSREDQSVFSGQARDKFRRKSSLDQDHSSDRAHTQIHRTNRRAEIVAAVTQRLYSSKKNSEDNTANASSSDLRPSESSDVRMALATKMRFQEISRRMLAKRRRICVDTQTEDLKTLRVKDTGCLTDSQEIPSKDVAILTDRHEDFENISRNTSPVLRVKEVATLTERQRCSPVRYKDVGSITDEHDEEYEAHSPRNDSGILSDDTQNYAESSFSSAADASELCSETLNAQRLEERSVEFAETSTNTVDASPETRVICSSAQTGTEVASVEEQKCHVGCAKIPECCHHQVGQNSERNTISISLPDAISITIEMSSLVESSIAVMEGDEVVKGKPAIDRKDGFTQTEVKAGMERGTDTEDDGNRVCFNDFTMSSRPSVNQSDGKTFRIENIFQDPKCGARRSCPKIEIMPDTTEYAIWKNSLVFRNSVGTSFVPQTRERSTEIERENFQAEAVQVQFPRRASVTCRRSIGDFYGPRRRCNSLSPARRIFTWRDDRPSSVSGKTPLEKNEGTHPGRRDPSTDFERKSAQLDEEKKSERKIISPEEEEERYMKKWERKNSRRGRNFTSQAADQLSQLQLNIADLKSPPLVASMDSRANLEQDPNFSDDSLDLNESAKRESLKAKKALALEKYKEEEESCPPDVVAHTKKDSSKLPTSTRPEKEDQPATCSDFEENHVVEFPKTKPIEKIPVSKCSQILDYKSLILGRGYFDPASKQDDVVEEECDVLLAENETDDRIGKKRVSFSISEVLGDELRRRIDYSRNGMTPKSIIKKRDGITEEFARLPNEIEGGSYGIIGESAQSRLQDFLIPQNPIKEPMVSRCDTRSTLDCPKSSLRFIERYCSSDEEYQNSRESLCKKVKFSVPESLETTITSDSDSCGEAIVSEDEDEGIRKDPHDLLAEYFSEAATFMRNMNSMNEYMSANKLFERFLAKDQLERRTDVDKRDLVNDYLRQHRPCLPTPTSKNDLNYYPTDEDFVVSTESYEKCLKGLEKLERCIEKVERHSQLLQEKFEGDIDESADTKRDLVGNSIDSMKFRSGSTSGRSSLARKMQELNETRRLKSSLREFDLGDLSLPQDQVTSNGNFNFEDVMGSILDNPRTDVSSFSFRGSSQEPRAKYSKRMSDVSSKLRGRYGGRKRDSSSSSCDTSGVGNYLSPGRNDGSSSSRLRKQSARIPSIFADRTRDCGKEKNRNGFSVEGGDDLLPRSSSLSPRRISRSKFIFDNSTSSETAEASGGSTNLAFAVGEKFKHPASPRAKFLQLLGERRRIVRSSRSTNNAY